MQKFQTVLIIMLSAIVLLTVSACEKKSDAPSSDTWLQSEESVIHTESVLHSEPESSEDTNPPETSATMPSSPTPTAEPVSPFENFSFDLSGDQTSLYARKLHIVSGSDQTCFFGKDTILSTQGQTLDRNDITQYGYLIYSYSDEQYSINGSCAAVIVDWKGNSTGTLVYCDGTSVVRISENVDSFCLSADGSHLAYLTGTYEHGVGGSLYLYNGQTNESELIAEGSGRLFVLSPTGQSISYTQFYRQYDPDSFICYAKTGAEAAIEVGRDRYSIAISDDAKTIFCLKREYSNYELYVYQDLIEKVLCDSLPLDGPPTDTNIECFGPVFTFNNDCTQIVYSDSDSTWFFVRGEEPVMVFDSGNAVLMGIRSTDESWSKTLYSTYYQEKILADYARSSCSTSFSGTPNLCYVLFGTDSEEGMFDEYLIPHTVTLPDYYAEHDELGTMIMTSYDSPTLKINPYLNESWLLEADQYLGRTKDGRIFFVRENALYSLGTDGAEEKLADLTGDAVPYCTPYLEKIFIMDYQAQDYSFGNNVMDNYDFFYTLYAIDPDSPAELCLVSEKVSRYTLMIHGSDITFAKYSHLTKESSDEYAATADLELYFSNDGVDFDYITTYPQYFYIMCC